MRTFRWRQPACSNVEFAGMTATDPSWGLVTYSAWPPNELSLYPIDPVSILEGGDAAADSLDLPRELIPEDRHPWPNEP